jgi:hypothetical protein
MPEQLNQIIQEIQIYTHDNIFEVVEKKNRIIDEWRTEWIDFLIGKYPDKEKTLSKGSLGGGGQLLTLFTVKEIQDYICGIHQIAIPEKKIVPVFSADVLAGEKPPKFSFDIFIPDEGAAIEICMSAITHEWEKDILKGLADRETKILRVMVKRHFSGENYYSRDIADSPGGKTWKALGAVYKLDIDAVNLVSD